MHWSVIDCAHYKWETVASSSPSSDHWIFVTLLCPTNQPLQSVTPAPWVKLQDIKDWNRGECVAQRPVRVCGLQNSPSSLALERKAGEGGPRCACQPPTLTESLKLELLRRSCKGKQGEVGANQPSNQPYRTRATDKEDPTSCELPDNIPKLFLQRTRSCQWPRTNRETAFASIQK